ncbi:leucyl/phenylalanyl-tRNA--protein transferase [Tahibacter aquaticus]|uniref:Leucyl/phenylalanyl-tRNA--protein transferase n=1 Tax=Tahibacter aquaticus TaxID=520092 RepID=A0A4R6YRN0_9GAMM|nr:leucyl/phenylalanyl-tRNA--protein transferase [Tahibacter aquaticus]TDR40714.1 leucyl/phenylalanyl-tRNA--protein transferase [Tahibacter aquaticus]
MIRIAILRAGRRDAFPPVEQALADPNGLLAAGGDLSPQRLLDAYAQGIFPWFSDGEPILWWSPDPRMLFDTSAMHLPRRLRRWLRDCDWQIHADRDFAAVMRACAAPRAGHSGTWITDAMLDAYQQMHRLGHAHSVEVYADETLVGGIYGVAIGQMFFGESMFSRASNGSKVALLALARLLRRRGWPLIDAQVSSDHLTTLGAFELPRTEFGRRIRELGQRPGRIGSWEADCSGWRGADLLQE